MSRSPLEAVAGHLQQLALISETAAGQVASTIPRYARWVLETLQAGGTVFFCGNGGSAATAEHVAAEYVARFRQPRRALPALPLTLSSALLTASANDLGFEHVFARPLAAFAGPGDLLVLHSTSGRSANLLRAAETASALGVRTVGMLADGGGELREKVDLAVLVPTDDSAIAQELQLALEHGVVGWVESELAAKEDDMTDAVAHKRAVRDER